MADKTLYLHTLVNNKYTFSPSLIILFITILIFIIMNIIHYLLQPQSTV